MLWVVEDLFDLEDASPSGRSLNLATFRSREVRYLAVDGESGMTCQAKKATTTLGKPSIKNKALHGSRGPCEESLTMSQATVLAQLIANGAAEMNSPTR